MLHRAIFLASCLTTLKINTLQVAEDILHVTTLEAQLAMASRKSMQSLQKIEPMSILRSRCRGKEVGRHIAKKACYTL